MKEFADLYIGHYLDRAEKQEQVGVVEDMSLGLLRVYSDLLRSAFDARDLADFQVFHGALLKSFQFREIPSYREDADELKWQRDHGHLSPGERERVISDLALVERIANFSDRLSQGQQHLRFGLNSWMLREWEHNNVTADAFLSWHGAIGGFGNPEALWEVLIQCLRNETEEQFGWDWWLLDWHEGEAQRMDFDASLMQLFCVRAAEEMKGYTAEALSQIKLPITRETRYVADRMAEVVREMIGAESKWRAVLGEGAVGALQGILRLLEDTRARGREEEIDQLIKAPLDQGRVRRFRDEFVASWQEHASLRAVVMAHGSFEHVAAAVKGHDWFGLNRLELKEPFAEGEFISMGEIGREFGRWLGDSENQTVLKQLVDALPTRGSLAVKPDDLLTSLDTAVTSCHGSGLSPVILILGDWRAGHTIEGSSTFVNRGESAAGQLIGHYGKVPVFKITSRMRHIVLVVDIGAIGRWKQYEVRSQSPTEEIVGEHILFAVEAVSDEYARKLIAEQPEFKKEPNTKKDLTENEAVRRLQQRVHLRILQHFDFVIEKKEAGFKIVLGKEW